MVGEFEQFVAAVVGLDDDMLEGLGDVMLKADDLLEAEFLAELGCDLHRFVIDRVAPIEADQRGRAIFAGEKLRAEQCPQGGVGIVVAHKDRYLEFIVHADLVEHIGEQNRAGVDIEHLLYTVAGVVVKEFIEPFQGMAVGLSNAAKIAGDGVRSPEVDIGAVRAFGVEGFDISRADDLHGSRKGDQVSVIFLLLHLADADEAPGQQFALVDRAFCRCDQPRKILARRNFEGNGKIIGKLGFGSFCAEYLFLIIRYGDEGARIALLFEPF